MKKRKLLAFSLLLLCLTAGSWLISRSNQPDPSKEVAREEAGRMVLGEGQGQNAGIATHITLPAAQLNPPVEPVTIEIGSVVNWENAGNSQLERWQRGEIEIESGESPYSKAQIEALRQAALQAAYNPNIQQASETVTAGPSPANFFDSLDYTECCAGGGSVPPDPEMAVGSNHIIAVVNVALEIYDKSGHSLIGPLTFANFFAASSNCNNSDPQSSLFDPNVIYDEEADRYMVAIDRNLVNDQGKVLNGGAYYCVAVSASSDPTSAWHLYAFAMDKSSPGNVWMDYPHAGVGQNAIFMGGNLFTTGNNPEFVQGRVWAFPKTAMYAGQAASAAEATTGQDFTPQPINFHGFNQGSWPSSSLHYFFAIRDNDNGGLHTLLTWNNPFNSRTAFLPDIRYSFRTPAWCFYKCNTSGN